MYESIFYELNCTFVGVGRNIRRIMNLLIPTLFFCCATRMLLSRFGLDITPAIQSLDWQASIMIADIALGKGVEFGTTKSNVLAPVCIEEFLLVSDGVEDIFMNAPVAFEECCNIAPRYTKDACCIAPVTRASLIYCCQHLLVALRGVPHPLFRHS